MSTENIQIQKFYTKNGQLSNDFCRNLYSFI